MPNKIFGPTYRDMVKMNVTYLGDKHCKSIHEPSGAILETDAPKDNAGRGELFSPTDLLGASLAACVLTTMAIVGEREGLVLKGARAEVAKEMVSNPRRIGALPLKVYMPAGLNEAQRQKMEATAHHCPVHKSLHPDIKIEMQFIYPD